MRLNVGDLVKVKQISSTYDVFGKFIEMYLPERMHDFVLRSIPNTTDIYKILLIHYHPNWKWVYLAVIEDSSGHIFILNLKALQKYKFDRRV